jgi:hypothetical protein
MPEGEERPIAFALRTLSTAKRNYAQIEREGLPVVFGIHKFHEYLYGRKFTILSNHKSLEVCLMKPQECRLQHHHAYNAKH